MLVTAIVPVHKCTVLRGPRPSKCTLFIPHWGGWGGCVAVVGGGGDGVDMGWGRGGGLVVSGARVLATDDEFKTMDSS